MTSHSGLFGCRVVVVLVSRACRVRVVGSVSAWPSGARSLACVLAWALGFRPATRTWVGLGRCLTTRPQLRLRVVKHLCGGGGVAGMAGGGVWVGWGPGSGVDEMREVVMWMLIVVLFPALHCGRIGFVGPRGPLADPWPDDRDAKAVRPCRWRPSSSRCRKKQQKTNGLRRAACEQGSSLAEPHVWLSLIWPKGFVFWRSFVAGPLWGRALSRSFVEASKQSDIML